MQARKIQNRPVVNRDARSDKLQQMKDEILLLREELDRAKLETNLMTSRSKSGVCEGDVVQVRSYEEFGEEGAGPAVVRDTRQHLEELEECLNQCQVQLSSYSCCVRKVRGLLLRVMEGREGGVVGMEGEGLRKRGASLSAVGNEEEPRKEGEVPDRERAGLGESDKEELLQECLHLLASCCGVETSHSDPPAWSDTSEETISQLRSELEKCRMDLRTDEQAFAEKGEELAELQLVCDTLMREKDRVEGMWLAAQGSEAAMQGRVSQLTETLVALEGGVAGGEEVGASTSEQSVAEEDSLSEDVALSSPEGRTFVANRSLLEGKVKTSSLEVRAGRGGGKGGGEGG